MTAGVDDEAELEGSRAPLLSHLTELRSRLIICVAAIALAFVFCFAFAEPIFIFLVEPFKVAQDLLAAEKGGEKHGPFSLLLTVAGLRDAPAASNQSLELVYTAALGFFFTKLKLAGFGAVILTFPVIAWQLYRFVAPGLYRRERAAFFPFLIAAPVLFTLGAALVYYIMLPFVLWFSLTQQVTVGNISVDFLPKVDEYLSLVTTLLLAFGLCFQLPVIVTLMGLAGVVSSEALAKGRRYAIVGVVVVAAVVTPPDPISQIMLALPLVLLYEISIWCVRLIELRRPKEAVS